MYDFLEILGIEKTHPGACGWIETGGRALTSFSPIDVADFAVGLSRQLYGLTMHSERPEHRMYEQWHPLGTVGVITAETKG